MPRTRLPDFVIIGAAKSATTWLALNLGEHPEIYLPRSEIHYFSRDVHRGADWYGAHFVGAQPHQLVGEHSNTYLACPNTPRLLKELLPHAHLVVQLRNPIDRAYSDYCMHLRGGLVSSAIDHYLDVDTSPRPQFIDEGRYHKHISRFLEFYPRERLSVLIYEDIARDPDALLPRLCRDLGVGEPPGAPEFLEERVNHRETPVLDPRVRQLLRPLRPIVEPFLHRPWMRKLRFLVGSVPEYPPLTMSLRDELAMRYRPEVERLSELVGRDLSFWLDPP